MPNRIKLWWGFKTPLEKILMALLAIAMIMIIILTSVMKHNVQRKPPEVCNTFSCLTEALKIMRYTDPKTNPCDDFYQFTCGNFDENSNDEENLPFLQLLNEQLVNLCNEIVRPTDHEIIKLVKKLYTTCANNDGFGTNSKQTLLNTIEALGGWPVVEGSKWDEETFDWRNASYKLRERGYYDEIFVNVDVDRDADNKSNFILEVLLADVYDYRYGIINVDKAQIMADVAVILGAQETPEVVTELTEAHNLQQELQKLVYYKQHKEHGHQKYTISEYQKLCDTINWLEFINNMLGPKVQVKDDQVALFPPPEVFKAWFDVILKAPKRVQANYMIWKVVERILPYLSRELQYFKLGLEKRQNREVLCLDVIWAMDLFYPTQIILHKKYVSDDAKKSIQNLLDNIKSELVHSLNRSTLFKMTNREKALDTIKALKIEVVPDANYLDNKVVDKLFVETTHTGKGTFLDFLAQATKNKRTLKLLSLKNSRIVDPEMDLAFPGLPSYQKDENTIYALGLATHKMYFNEKRPNYINYGIIGAMLEHVFNKLLEESVETNQTAISIGKCMSEDAFKDDESLVLAYLAIGQHITYAAYQYWVKAKGKELPLANVQQTANQLFWISSVSTYCKPNNFHGFYSNKLLNPKEYIFRAIRNNQRFSKDFNCPPGSAMFKTSKCGVI